MECAYDPEYPPLGLYLVRIWDIGVDVLGPTTWTGHVVLNKTGPDTYTGTPSQKLTEFEFGWC